MPPAPHRDAELRKTTFQTASKTKLHRCGWREEIVAPVALPDVS
jgi:hypothetical protein